MTKHIYTVFLWLFLQFPASAQDRYWQQQVNFTIDVSLNDVEHTLDAFEKVVYVNNSPDTLNFIWFHIWPNAYKNDQTAFSEQMLLNNRTDFYFSDREQKGYINRLDFKVNGSTAKTEDHPRYIDIIKLVLPKPLAPLDSITITTPFHVKLPGNFSRGGHLKQAYSITQWYPKPAVYDAKGWHPMPYLDQGEFYSEFGNYDVRISLPRNYVVAATGILQDAAEQDWLKQRSNPASLNAKNPALTARHSRAGTRYSKTVPNEFPLSSPEAKTLHFIQQNVHDFAWFADKRFIVNADTLLLASGHVINVYSYYLPADAPVWKNSIRFIKAAVLTRSSWLGAYPFEVVSAVQGPMGFSGGMEYPTITSISGSSDEKELDETVAHEVGHNWLYGILASNERRFPWMDEGMNTYYDARYKAYKYPHPPVKQTGIRSRLPQEEESLAFETVAGLRKDQPMNTPSEEFSELNYGLVAYYKTGEWMKILDSLLGRQMFDSCMHEYYRRWKFRHPYPEDFRRVLESVSGRNLEAQFRLLDTTGSLLPAVKKSLKLVSFFNLRNTRKVNYVSVSPAVGVNLYDGFMAGAIVHNYQLPLNPFSFFVMPLVGTRSKRLNGMARASYSWFPSRAVHRIEAGLNAARFSMDEYHDDHQATLFTSFNKLVPFARITFNNRNALSKQVSYLQFKSFLIREGAFNFRQQINGPDTSDLVNVVSRDYVINQLKFVVQDFRMLYPYRAEVLVEQNKVFVRAAFTGNYFFNYANNEGGMKLRVFAGRFFYKSSKAARDVDLDRFSLNLSGANGHEDYTYSNYFAGRNKFQNWASQQIMVRDGAFKVRTDLLSNKVGKTDAWLAALNLATDVPRSVNPLQLLPFKVPLRVFADLGTYAEAWDKNEETSRFLFDAGFQLSFFKDALNIYIPVLYSSVFHDYFRSTLGENRFLKTISFSLDIQNFELRKIVPGLP